MNNIDNSTIVSLHRPYHSPLWVARWVCEYIRFYSSQDATRIDSADFFFFFIRRLVKMYEKNENIQEYVSRSTIEEVFSYFNQYKTKEERNEMLDSIMHSSRSSQLEKHVYSIYKASTYAVNLAEDKLGFIEGNNLTEIGGKLNLQKTPNVDIKASDRLIFLYQILAKDFYFFVPFCMLQQYKNKGVQPEDAIFDFSQQYHKVQRFDYTHRSHDNYTKVRMQWIIQLKILSESNRIKKWVSEAIEKQYNEQFEILQKEIKEFTKEYLKGINKDTKLDAFYDVYKALSRRGDGSGYVNLYDMSLQMNMGYVRFEELLQTYYEQRNRKEHIFLVNIIATMDVRRRFVVYGKPVMKIKIQK